MTTLAATDIAADSPDAGRSDRVRRRPMRVLVGVDGSAAAALAARLAGSLALPPGSTITLVAVERKQERSSYLPGTVPPPELRLERMGQQASAGETLEQMLARLGPTLVADDRFVEVELREGWPATAIVDEAERIRADLVVVGTRGQGAVRSALLGSVSAEVVDNAPCPVLVARREAIERAVFADDGSGCARRAEELLIWSGMLGGARVDVLSVDDTTPLSYYGLDLPSLEYVREAYANTVRESRTRHEAIALGAAERLDIAGIRTGAAVRSGDPAPVILDFAAEVDADLIVTGTHGRTGLQRLVLGSVARKVLMHAHASVLIARAQPLREHVLVAQGAAPARSLTVASGI